MAVTSTPATASGNKAWRGTANLDPCRSSLNIYVMASVEPEAVKLLKLDRDRLENAMSHLRRSNQELKAAMEAEGPDPDMRTAISENIVIIAKYAAQVEKLDQEIDQMQRGVQIISDEATRLT
ncbi:hypothetical protein H632_c2636p0 [Helicosporidium sp. ATCC 50920]|nr:hypothetical protein H632_c2636p0 [Helicosporidium sp. ATCC 50920]|eukprot:KDD73006.1 hypothetical protein H632_c2636p0 [Helicosporidium sp. ATCC 50920]